MVADEKLAAQAKANRIENYRHVFDPSLLDALARFRPDGFDPSTIRASALRFRRERFLQEFGGLTNRKAMALGNSELNCQHLAKTS